MPFPPLASSEWQARDDGGIEFTSALKGGLAVHFQVLPGDRMFEIRFGVTNRSLAALHTTWVQLCSGFEKMGTLRDQAPEGVRLLADGMPIGWKDAGQDVSWIEAQRDPVSCRLTRSCYFKAWARSHAEEAQLAQPAPDLMVLARTIDAPIVAKSSLDSRRHVAFYSPWGRAVMFNTFAPCCHSDPFMQEVPRGETRWIVLYGLFYEGELGELFSALGAEHRVSRAEEGLPE